jgi:6-phospho-beta-glucosidase
VPVVLEIADRVRANASAEAWIVDFTNPVGIVTRALLDAGHRAVGLCNVAIGFQRSLARMLGVDPANVLVDQVGLNHLTWVRAVRVDGRDVLPELLTEYGDAIAKQSGNPLVLIEELGAIPSYYLHYFYAHDEVLAEQRDGVPRAATVAEIERQLLELYRNPDVDEKPRLLEQRGGAFYSEAAIGLVSALATGSGDVHVVDIRNGSTLAGLRTDDVVEVPAHIGGNGADPLPQEPLAPELLGLVQHVTAYERLTVEAAVTGDAVLARKALLAHPLIGQYAIVEQLAEKLLAEARAAA